MRTALYAAAVLTLGVFAAGTSARHAGATAEDGPILPGYWESTSSSSFGPQGKVERKCITGRAINAYLTGPVNNHYSCHYTDKKIGDGTFSMTGDCVDHGGIPAKVAVHGVYTDTSFSMSGRMRIVIGGLAIPVSASTDAHRLSAECPAPEASPPPETAAAAPASSGDPAP